MLHHVAEEVGFEPTDAFTPTDFKSAALSRTQPSLHKIYPKQDSNLQNFASKANMYPNSIIRAWIKLKWRFLTASNRRPADYKSAALPTELRNQKMSLIRRIVAPRKIVLLSEAQFYQSFRSHTDESNMNYKHYR
jgi:hypothetical protein